MNPITPAGLLAEVAAKSPKISACAFMGRSFSYDELIKKAEDCARSFAAIGVHEGSRVLIYMPIIPQALACFYGLNLLGASAVFISAAPDGAGPADCLKEQDIRAVVTTDSLYSRLAGTDGLPTTIIARPQDAMGGLNRLRYRLTSGRRVKKLDDSYGLLTWDSFLQGGKAYRGEFRAEALADREALILCGGETTIITNAGFFGDTSPITGILRAPTAGEACVLSMAK